MRNRVPQAGEPVNGVLNILRRSMFILVGQDQLGFERLESSRWHRSVEERLGIRGMWRGKGTVLGRYGLLVPGNDHFYGLREEKEQADQLWRKDEESLS
jgi:hypothetical protein